MLSLNDGADMLMRETGIILVQKTSFGWIFLLSPSIRIESVMLTTEQTT